MDEYENKLNSFRKQKRKAEFINKCKTYLWVRPTSSLTSLISIGNHAETTPSENTANSSAPLIEIDDSSADDYVTDTDSDSKELPAVKDSAVDEDDVEESFNWIKFSVSVLIWICLFSYSVYIEFGAVFFILSCFYVIWTNTRTRPRKRNEISAYSVFNPNCERIEGTIDAKQLESEMICGMVF